MTIFRGLTIATAGELGDQFTGKAMAQWITGREGTFSAQMTGKVTHFVCTKQQYRDKDERG